MTHHFVLLSYYQNMTTRILEKTTKNLETKELETKAAILDELLEFIEDKYLAYLMNITEKEDSISLPKAKKMLKE